MNMIWILLKKKQISFFYWYLSITFLHMLYSNIVSCTDIYIKMLCPSQALILFGDSLGAHWTLLKHVTCPTFSNISLTIHSSRHFLNTVSTLLKYSLHTHYTCFNDTKDHHSRKRRRKCE